MQISDVIADMLTRIRNANDAKHESVDVPASNMKKAIESPSQKSKIFASPLYTRGPMACSIT